MSNVDISLLKSVARRLRYKELPSLVGRKIVIQAVDTIEANVKSALADTPVSHGVLRVSERKFIEGSMAKYGLLDLTFASSSYRLDTDFYTGLGALKTLGFLPSEDQAQSMAKLDDLLGADSADPMCLRELAEDINHNEVVIRLFLRGYRIEGNGPHLFGKLPADYLPQEFTIEDAAMTNAGFVWFHKHFYW